MKSDIHNIKEEILLKSVLDTVSDGVTVIDKDLRVVFCNRSIYEKYGDVKGRFCYEAYRGRVEPCDDCLINQVLEDGVQRKLLRDTLLPNGEIRWVECISDILNDKNGEIIGAVEIVRDVTEQMQLSEEYASLKREVERQAQFENIITQSKSIKKLFQLVEKIAPTPSTVLITGESGTGKELFARAIHTNSKRRKSQFVSINCGAIPENLLESELFGHVKGAFTGAVRSNKGLISTADGGTLFLDEIGEIPLSLQVKLLRFLQDGIYRNIGDTKSRKVDVRIICATNRNLEEAVKDKVFREDLYFRLNVIPIYLPPLRERKEDIPLLAAHILQELCDDHSRHIPGISAETLKGLMDYSWPGNIRELQNIIEYAIHVTTDNETIRDQHLPPAFAGKNGNSENQSQFVSIEEYTKRTILALQNEKNEEEIAEILGISRKNLWEKRKRWSLPRPISPNSASRR